MSSLLIEEVLCTAREAGASDVHLAGTDIHGQIITTSGGVAKRK